MATLDNNGGVDVGVHGHSDSNSGVFGSSASGFGVDGRSTNGFGVDGVSINNAGVHGRQNGQPGTNFPGVHGLSNHGVGVHGESVSGGNVGVLGVSHGNTGVGLFGTSTNGVGVLGESDNGTAGRFEGFVEVLAGLRVDGDKAFRIDHPLDPENQYLLHNSIESSERKNVYDGVVQLDEDGAAWVDLPEWFEALNGDFRYQLTAVGGAAPNLHVAEEVSENRFKLAGGQGGMKVCWQVTGTRKDAWAAANPFVVEEEKPEEERGRYLDPSLYDAPEEQSVIAARR